MSFGHPFIHVVACTSAALARRATTTTTHHQERARAPPMARFIVARLVSVRKKNEKKKFNEPKSKGKEERHEVNEAKFHFIEANHNQSK